MKDKVNVRVLLTGLSLLGVFIAAAVVVVLMLAPRDDSPSFPETSSIDRPVGGNDEESSRFTLNTHPRCPLWKHEIQDRGPLTHRGQFSPIPAESAGIGALG